MKKAEQDVTILFRFFLMYFSVWQFPLKDK
jgi:hypothetical protein